MVHFTRPLYERGHLSDSMLSYQYSKSSGPYLFSHMTYQEIDAVQYIISMVLDTLK